MAPLIDLDHVFAILQRAREQFVTDGSGFGDGKEPTAEQHDVGIGRGLNGAVEPAGNRARESRSAGLHRA